MRRFAAVLCSVSAHTVVGCAEPIDPTFPSIQENVFDQSCAFSSCHSGYAADGELDLTAGAAYANLINVPSEEEDGWVRVVPGDPDASLLYQALLGPVGEVGQMPDGYTPEDPYDPAKAEAIRQWIEDGALEEEASAE